MNQNSLFWKMYSKRSTICFFVIMLLFLSCVLRIAEIVTTGYSEAYSKQNRLRITIAKQRGTIFDCNMKPITNSSKKIIAAVSPTPRAITEITKHLNDEEAARVLNALKLGKPVLTEVPEKINCEGIVCTEVYEHTASNTPAIHLVGYTDSNLGGVSGLEYAYDDILKYDREISIAYECGGNGKILEGVDPELTTGASVNANGVITTLNLEIQEIAEYAASFLDMGAVVIADVTTGKIRATVSRPHFDPTKTAEYLDASDSPLLNRAINAYNVGSVFKPCVAATGIENNKKGFCYNCTGSCKIMDRRFRCHKAEGHGFISLKTAIANSCNTYFYNFASYIGENDIYNTATTLRFGQPLYICKGITASKGNLPQKKELSNAGALANFSIGQGELLLSPISMLTLYCAIAGNGSYYIPSVVEGTLKNGKLSKYDIGKPTRVMSESTAEILRKYLSEVLNDGTGEAAKPKNTTAAGKTATAQTGKYENGAEVCQGWFCGFFPAEDPKYTVIVFSENTAKQTKSCGEVFKIIAEKITALENS